MAKNRLAACMDYIKKMDLTVLQKSVLYGLIVEVDRAGRAEIPVSRIAKNCGCADRSVRKALRDLEKKQLLSITARHGRSFYNSYDLPFYRSIFELSDSAFNTKTEGIDE